MLAICSHRQSDLTRSAGTQGGLTWLWLDSPYVVTARKLFNWAVEANDKGDVFPVSRVDSSAMPIVDWWWAERCAVETPASQSAAPCLIPGRWWIPACGLSTYQQLTSICPYRVVAPRQYAGHSALCECRAHCALLPAFHVHSVVGLEQDRSLCSSPPATACMPSAALGTNCVPVLGAHRPRTGVRGPSGACSLCPDFVSLSVCPVGRPASARLSWQLAPLYLVWHPSGRCSGAQQELPAPRHACMPLSQLGCTCTAAKPVASCAGLVTW
jgi:hypothetical protein